MLLTCVQIIRSPPLGFLKWGSKKKDEKKKWKKKKNQREPLFKVGF